MLPEHSVLPGIPAGGTPAGLSPRPPPIQGDGLAGEVAAGGNAFYWACALPRRRYERRDTRADDPRVLREHRRDRLHSLRPRRGQFFEALLRDPGDGTNPRAG